MRSSVSLVAAFAASCALALPSPIQPRTHSNESSGGSEHSHSTAPWNDGPTADFVIHESCNASETTQLRKGLADAVALAEHAKQHILRYSNSSEHYRKYFGDAPSGEAIGYYEKVISGDRGNALFRCDNPDGNCELPGTSIKYLFAYTILTVDQSGVVTGVARTAPARPSYAPYPIQLADHWSNFVRWATPLPEAKPTPTLAQI